MMQLIGWPPIKFWSRWGGGNFLDTWQILGAVDCFREIGLEVYKLQNECMVYAYGSPLLTTLSFFRIGGSQTGSAGFVLMALVALTIVIAVSKLGYARKYTYALVVGIICSPPILLLAERGNFDIIMAFGLISASILHAKGKSAASTIILFILALFKYYTAPLLLFMAVFSKNIKTKILAITMFAIACTSIYRDLQITQFKLNFVSTNITFGLGHEFLFLASNEKLAWISDYYRLFGIAMLSSFTVLFFLYTRKKEQLFALDHVDRETRIMYSMSTLTLISCYMAGGNNDYRLIFFVVSWAMLTSMLKFSDDLKIILAVLLCQVLWFTFPSGGLEIIGDFALSIYLSLNLGYVLALINKKRLRISLN